MRHCQIYLYLISTCVIKYINELQKEHIKYLSKDSRDEIGFSWGSCAWRHCGALADAQEAIDQLDHQVGMLEPFECLFWCSQWKGQRRYSLTRFIASHQHTVGGQKCSWFEARDWPESLHLNGR